MMRLIKTNFLCVDNSEFENWRSQNSQLLTMLSNSFPFFRTFFWYPFHGLVFRLAIQVAFTWFDASNSKNCARCLYHKWLRRSPVGILVDNNLHLSKLQDHTRCRLLLLLLIPIELKYKYITSSASAI
jgi:hypothetical protein